MVLSVAEVLRDVGLLVQDNIFRKGQRERSQGEKKAAEVCLEIYSLTNKGPKQAPWADHHIKVQYF